MFELSPGELQKLSVWKTQHDKTCPHHHSSKQGAIGGRLTYSFTQTGLGMVTEITCSCGDKIDVTAYEEW